LQGEDYQQLFADPEIQFHGQGIALVVADTQRHAEAAAKLVKVGCENDFCDDVRLEPDPDLRLVCFLLQVTYAKDGKEPVVTIAQALEKKSMFPQVGVY
jgi:hypothetical protein